MKAERGPVNIVAAVADNWAIGRGNALLWHISADMKFFRELTSGGTVVMGRKTYLSIGRPLPKRWNIVISRSTDWLTITPCTSPALGGLKVVRSLGEALDSGEGEIYVLGGGEIYRQAIELADRLYITHVHVSPEDADTFFPVISPDEWEEVNRSVVNKDLESGLTYEFAVYDRIISPNIGRKI